MGDYWTIKIKDLMRFIIIPAEPVNMVYVKLCQIASSVSCAVWGKTPCPSSNWAPPQLGLCHTAGARRCRSAISAKWRQESCTACALKTLISLQNREIVSSLEKSLANRQPLNSLLSNVLQEPRPPHSYCPVKSRLGPYFSNTIRSQHRGICTI